MLRSSQLDNCNGKFTYNPSTGKYTYAYYGQCALPAAHCVNTTADDPSPLADWTVCVPL
jgi:hypothetical protein